MVGVAEHEWTDLDLLDDAVDLDHFCSAFETVFAKRL